MTLGAHSVNQIFGAENVKTFVASKNHSVSVILGVWGASQTITKIELHSMTWLDLNNIRSDLFSQALHKFENPHLYTREKRIKARDMVQSTQMRDMRKRAEVKVGGNVTAVRMKLV